MDFYVVLARAGKRVQRRKSRTAKFGNFQKISKEEAKQWFIEKLGGTVLWVKLHFITHSLFSREFIIKLSIFKILNLIISSSSSVCTFYFFFHLLTPLISCSSYTPLHSLLHWKESGSQMSHSMNSFCLFLYLLSNHLHIGFIQEFIPH